MHPAKTWSMHYKIVYPLWFKNKHSQTFHSLLKERRRIETLNIHQETKSPFPRLALFLQQCTPWSHIKPISGSHKRCDCQQIWIWLDSRHWAGTWHRRTLEDRHVIRSPCRFLPAPVLRWIGSNFEATAVELAGITFIKLINHYLFTMLQRFCCNDDHFYSIKALVFLSAVDFLISIISIWRESESQFISERADTFESSIIQSMNKLTSSAVHPSAYLGSAPPAAF